MKKYLQASLFWRIIPGQIQYMHKWICLPYKCQPQNRYFLRMTFEWDSSPLVHICALELAFDYSCIITFQSIKHDGSTFMTSAVGGCSFRPAMVGPCGPLCVWWVGAVDISQQLWVCNNGIHFNKLWSKIVGDISCTCGASLHFTGCYKKTAFTLWKICYPKVFCTPNVLHSSQFFIYLSAKTGTKHYSVERSCSSSGAKWLFWDHSGHLGHALDL